MKDRIPPAVLKLEDLPPATLRKILGYLDQRDIRALDEVIPEITKYYWESHTVVDLNDYMLKKMKESEDPLEARPSTSNISDVDRQNRPCTLWFEKALLNIINIIHSYVVELIVAPAIINCASWNVQFPCLRKLNIANGDELCSQSHLLLQHVLPQLEVLKITNVRKNSSNDEVSALLMRANNLRRFEFCCPHMDKVVLRAQHFPHSLEELYINCGRGLAEGTITKLLKHLPSLHFLGFHACKDNVYEGGTYPNVKTVIIRDGNDYPFMHPCRVTFIESFTGLESLDIDYGMLTAEVAKILSKFENLVRFRTCGSKLTTIAKKVSEDCASNLSKLPKLEEIRAPYKDDLCLAITRDVILLKRLKILDVSSMQKSDEILKNLIQNLKKYPKMEELCFYGDCTPAKSKVIATLFPNLTVLKMGYPPILDD